MSTHAKFAPSKADIWLRCSLHVSLADKFPDISSAAAEEGTRLHEVAANFLIGKETSVDAVLVPYVDYISRTRDAAEDNHEFLVEEKVYIFEECVGTLDAAILDKNSLHVIDLKTGTSPVKAYENKQLILYALGIIKKYDLPKDRDVYITIVQPRKASGWPVDTWKTDVEKILSYEESFLKAIARAGRNPTFAMAGRHCYWCPAKLHCTAYLQFTGGKNGSPR